MRGYGIDVLQQVPKIICPVDFPPGGIVVPPSPKVGVAQMPTSELVLNREQVAKMKHVINIDPMDGIHATLSAANFSDVFNKIKIRLKGKEL